MNMASEEEGMLLHLFSQGKGKRTIRQDRQPQGIGNEHENVIVKLLFSLSNFGYSNAEFDDDYIF